MKTCFKCGIEKYYDEFYRHKEMADGHLNKCKECTKLDSKNNEKNSSTSSNAYDKTQKGVIRVLYKSMVQRSKKRNHQEPGFTKKEFELWAYDNNFFKLWETWKKNNYLRSLKPSVDREDDFISYIFTNMNLVTDAENRLHQYQDIVSGTGTSGKQCKPVVQYKDGFEIARYVSFSEAKRMMGYSMERPLRTGKIDRKGYSYKYE